MDRRQFLGACAAAAAAPAILKGQQRRPNLVFILSDDLGYADLGCFGARDIRTPNLDRMAADGVRFTDCYSNGPVCTPTRVGFLTGRYQQRFGKALEWALVPQNNERTGLSPKDTVLPRALKPLGYKSALIGKWHCGSLPQFRPNQHGFDESFGIYRGNADMYSHEFRDGTNDLFADGKPVKQEGYLTEMLAEKAVDFVRRNASGPFFLYLPFNAVHWPFQPPDRPDMVRNAQTWTDGTRDDYRKMTESMDTAIGAVMEELRRQGQDENTLVVFTNDNGGERLSDNSPYFHSKATLYEGGIRVPGIARWPGKIPAGSVTGQVAMTMDFTASLLAAAGAQPPDGIRLDGMDVIPIAAGRKPVEERTLFWRIQRNERRQVAARSGNWKYIQEPSGAHELLFDLSRDPGERKNLNYQHPEILERLRNACEAWQKDVNQDAAKAGPAANGLPG